MKRVIRVMLLIIAVLGFAYLVVSLVGSCVTNQPKTIKLPEVKDAAYVAIIQNTGKAYLTPNYEQFGTIPGKRTFVLHKFFELTGQSYQLRDRDLILDENIYGQINIKRRDK